MCPQALPAQFELVSGRAVMGQRRFPGGCGEGGVVS